MPGQFLWQKSPPAEQYIRVNACSVSYFFQIMDIET